MTKKFIINLVLILSQCFLQTHAQNLISIPDTLSGNIINLEIADSSHQFFNGINTSTIGYNGSYLGPTIILNKGQNVTMNLANMLSDTTTTHWHGLHVAPSNDGSPHSPILPSQIWSPSFIVLDNAATYWYHPHLHGKTLRQVVKGAAGLIIVRDIVESSLQLPRTYGIDDIPLVCQFQHIDSVTKQIILNDELDNITMVNGTINPMVNIPAQIVRLRILNASSHRVLQLGFNDGRTFWQITSDDGLLDIPVPLTRLRLGSGERAEILVNFNGQTGNTFYLNQYGNELPQGFPGGPAMMGSPIGPFDNITFNFLQINVVPATINPITSIPNVLTTNNIWTTSGASTMNFNIQGSPAMSMTNFTINGVKYDENINNFSKNLNDVMIWNITNQSMMAHPFHIHGNHFFITSYNGSIPPANLQGRKDVVLLGPNGGSATLVTKYEDFSDSIMPYMYHCHILSHEDNGMMGQFIVNPLATGISDEAFNVTAGVFPNPTNNGWNITGECTEKIIYVKIMNSLGQEIYKDEIETYNNKFQSNISSNELKGKVFFLNFKTEHESHTMKLMKK
ncbi:MAG TPA: multicopper oxidase domain-containing protein [Flavobacterium alvei]|nr:multicopper oxidase domain-containing protein [Bacteroidia bacterium]HQK39046.1 multicopper oxidase domain-containing protein [Flavobacterium alvei]